MVEIPLHSSIGRFTAKLIHDLTMCKLFAFLFVCLVALKLDANSLQGFGGNNMETLHLSCKELPLEY